MATDLGKRPVKSAGAKHDTFVLAQLERAEKRIRMLDLGAALFGFAALACAFIVTAALCDRAWSLPGWVRQLALGGFLLGGGLYLYYTLARPLLYRVNPYYAAQRVERTMPGAKNSVVNWLDLQQQKLAPAIKAALGQKAAKDLSGADIDHAFNTRRLVWSGGAAAACLGGLLACFVWLGGDAFFHLQRIFTPFSFGATTRTTLTITRPVNGDETVTLKRPVSIGARVEGKIPDPKSADAVKLLYRYQENEPYLERLMRQEGGDFTVSIAADDVRDGFLYKVVAGDVETPEYRITVRATPLLTSVQATYHFRPYVAKEDEEHYGRRTFKMEALRGTEITLFVHTNRPVKDAYLAFDGKDGRELFPAEKIEENPKAFQVKHIVDKTTRYRLEYTTPDGEAYADPSYQDLVAVPDMPPEPVVITAPGRDTQLPCNGVLQVEGTATDDVGVKSLTLQMRVINGVVLKGKPYRTDKELRLPSGGYPLTLAYKDYFDLKSVNTLDGKWLILQPDMELEYWLEAADACDYPKPNVTPSKHYRVKLLPPEKDQEKLNNQKNQAKQEQQRHEAAQNDSLKKEDRKRKDEQQREKDRAQDEKDALNNKPKEADQGSKPEAGANQANASENPADKKKDEGTNETLNKVQKALNERDKEQRNSDKGEAKRDPNEPAGKAKNDSAGEKRPPSEAKPDGKPEQNKEAGADKPAGAKTEPKNDQQGEAKPESKSDPMQSSSMNKPDMAARPDAPKPEKAEAKDQPKADPKRMPTPEQKQQSAQQKPDTTPNRQECPRGECKHGGENPDSLPSADKREVKTPTDKSAGKNDGKPNPGEEKAQPKNSGNPAESAENKPAQKKEDVAAADSKADKKPGSGGQAPKPDPKQAKPEDVSNLARNLDSDFPPERKEAAQNLQKIADEANDPKAREKAQKELEENGLKPRPAASNRPPPDDKKGNDPDAKPCDVKGDKGHKPGETGAAKGSEPQKQQVPPSDTKSLGKPQVDEKPQQLDDPAKQEELRKQREEYLKKIEEEMRKSGNFNEKAWQQFLKEKGDKISPPDIAAPKERPPFVPKENLLSREDEPVNPPKNPADDKATMLQLRKLADAIDKKALEKAGLTPDQWREFIKNYTDKARRQDPTAQETAAAPQNGGKLSGIGGTRTNPGATTGSNDPRSTDKAKPPPGYGDALMKFLQERSSSEDKK